MAGLTPDQARQLIEWAGGQRAAAREVGVAQSTVAYWLKPRPWTEEQNEKRRDRYRNDPTYRERKLTRNRDRYHAENGIQRAQRQLRMRRTKALHRRADRNQRRP